MVFQAFGMVANTSKNQGFWTFSLPTISSQKIPVFYPQQVAQQQKFFVRKNSAKNKCQKAFAQTRDLKPS